MPLDFPMDIEIALKDENRSSIPVVKIEWPDVTQYYGGIDEEMLVEQLVQHTYFLVE